MLTVSPTELTPVPDINTLFTMDCIHFNNSDFPIPGSPNINKWLFLLSSYLSVIENKHSNNPNFINSYPNILGLTLFINLFTMSLLSILSILYLHSIYYFNSIYSTEIYKLYILFWLLSLFSIPTIPSISTFYPLLIHSIF